MKPNFSRFMGASASVLLCSSAALGQTVTASVTGNVTDPNGAVIPNAKVVVHNDDTGVDTSATTDNAGLYRISFLPIGRYNLTITAPGFGEQKIPDFQLEALQTPTFNVKLTPGGGSETVNVDTAAPILNTSDATLSGTFTANTIQNFPLNGLDFSALTLYVPGSVSTAGTSGTTNIGRSSYYTDEANINGNRAQSNNYTLDGIDINESFNNLIAYSPAPEALEQIKVLTANSPADYGNVNGGGVVSVLKSGTNAFHGSLYGYLQDYRINANSWNNKHNDIAINPFSQAQFGATFGGPILHNKLFFFVDYLGSRFHQGGTGTASVLTQAMRNGDFSAVPVQLYDTTNNFTPFAGNTGLPVLNPVAKYIFAHPELYPLPNHAPLEGTLITNNFQGPQRNYRANNQGDIKLEYDPNQTDKFTAFYSMSTAYDGTTSVLNLTFPPANVYPSKVGGLNWVHIFSPSVVNSARVGFTRVVWDQGVPQDFTGQFGTNGDAVVGIPFPDQSLAGFTYQDIGSISGSNDNPTGLGTPAFLGGFTDNTFSYIDNLTIQRGNHTLSMGVQALRYQTNYITSNNSGFLGQLRYDGTFTQNPIVGALGYGPADFILNRVNRAQATLGSVEVGQRQWRAAGFISDDYKATEHLTLNFGVRYEYDQPWTEANNKTGNVDLTTGQLIYADSVPAGAPIGSGVCSTRACYQPNYRQIMPRLGFAYQATNRFVVRGGYGATSFYEGNSSNQRLTSITPFIQAVNATAIAPSNTSGGAPRSAEQGFAGGQVTGTGNPSFSTYPQDIQPAYVQEYNLTTEYALTRSLSLQVGYLGETGQHIEDYGNINQWRVANDPTSAPFYNNRYLGVNAIDPAVAIGSGNLLITESRAMMNYNALQAVLRQRLSNGLEYKLNYTYSKSMTNSLGNYGLNVNGYSGAFQNYFDSSADYGPAGSDVTHNVSGTLTYALPVGHGAKFFSGTNRIVDELIGGWKVAMAGVAYSGLPETPTSQGNGSQSYGTSRPNQYRRLKIVNRNIDHWFGTDPSATPCGVDAQGNAIDNGVCAFGLPSRNAVGGYAFGTARNGSLRGPGYLNVDASGFKDFHTYREQTIGFRFDAFNVFNIASYGNPSTGIDPGVSVADGSNFGNISNTGGPTRSVERHLQFSASYRF